MSDTITQQDQVVSPSTSISPKDLVPPLIITKNDGTGAQLPQVSETSTSVIHHAAPLDPSTFPNPPRPGSQQLPATIANVRHMLSAYGITARYNVISKKIAVNAPGYCGSPDNTDSVVMSAVISLATLNNLSVRQVPAYVLSVADENLYNPVAEWIASSLWDGRDRLSDICETVTEREGFPSDLKNILIIKWLQSAVAAALMPSGFKARGVLTFQGAQGIGKTSWFMSLVSDPALREMVLKVDHHLDGTNKDSILGAISHWLVEIGELDSSFRKDIARLKGFLTSNFDKIRRPYAYVPSEYPRRTVFFASVNQADFLIDNTGNSRWWTIPVESINYRHNIDMQQLFAQLAFDFHKGREWWLTKEEEDLLEKHNNEHKSVSVVREQLQDILDLELVGKDGNPTMTATDVLKKLGYNNPSNPKAKECAAILRELLGDPKKIHEYTSGGYR